MIEDTTAAQRLVILVPSRAAAKRALASLATVSTLIACSGGSGGVGNGTGGANANSGGSNGNNGGGAGATSIPRSDGDFSSDFLNDSASVSVSVAGNDCAVEAATLESSSLARVTKGSSTIFTGFAQTSGNNQDPVVARVDDGAVTWCKLHENDSPDGRALGLTWDGKEDVYVVYTIVGGGTDLEGKPGWFPSYGGHLGISGGGSKVSVLGRVSAATGELNAATHIIAVTMARKVNSHVPEGAPRVRADGSVEFFGSSAHKAIGSDGKNAMGCTDYPFSSRYRFSGDLTEAQCAQCTNCTTNVTPCGE